MSIETDIKAVLDAYANLTALISTRIYAVKLPQGVTYPAGRYVRISTNPTSHMAGRSSLSASRFQFDIWSTTYSELLNIKDEFINAIESSSIMTAILLNVNTSGYEQEQEVYRATIEFSFWYTGI